MKSDWGLARITHKNYPLFHCLYKISFSRLVTDLEEWDSPTMIDSRIASPSMDAHLKFSVDLPTDVELVILFVYSDSFDIVKDSNSDRNILLNYPI